MTTELDKVKIYTDGSLDPNTGKSGYGAVIEYQGYDEIIEIGNCFKHSTNNRMELLAVIKAIDWFEWKCSITVYSDSQYVVKAINNGWIKSWIKNGWFKSNGNKVKNADLWQQLIPLLDYHEFRIKWVRGHNGNKGNERADVIACSYRDKQTKNVDYGYIESLLSTT